MFWGVQKWGLEIVKNGPRVWAFCKIEFPGIQKPVQFFDQKSGFFKKCGNRGVGVIWWVRGLILVFLRVWVVFVVLSGCFSLFELGLVLGLGTAICFGLADKVHRY